MFYATTRYGGKFKALFEIIFQNMTTACFTVNETGMFLEFMTTQNIILTIMLPKECFQEYIYEGKDPHHFGLNSHVNKEFFKYIKNKDVFNMKINKQFVFDFEKISEDNVQMCLSVSIEIIQNITPMDHLEYNTAPFFINSCNFNQLCRSFHNIPVVNVTKRFGQLSFSFETTLTTKYVTFGKYNANDLEMVQYFYYSDQFTRICKIGSFVDDTIEVYIEKEKPLYLYCKSVIGSMKIFIYPKED